jgi:putative oxidoreductase
MSDFISLISRVLMASVFVLYGSMKFMDVASIINNPGTKRFMDMVASGAPAPTWLGYLIAAIETLGGIAIILGIKTRWVAWAFVIWLIIATTLGHPFWLMEGAAVAPNKANFYKNLAIMAAYLLLAIHGPGRYSVDGRPTTA